MLRTMLAIHHFTMLVLMVTSALLSISSERNTVTHHVRTMLAIHHFTMLVAMVTSALLSISSERNTVTPSCEDNVGNTPLHYACANGHLNIAQYLIREEHCNPSCETNGGRTPLHFACILNRAHIVQYLLSTGRVNPLTKSKSGYTALSWASHKYDTIKLFEPFEECRTAFPVHTFTKLILTGDSGAGKTTITELIVRLASSTAVECVADVQRYTAGIVPHHIQSEQLGNFVVYDFAGQQEYYSSHDAVLEQVMRRSAAMFLCVVDLSESKEKICESLHYWLSFIDNACSTAEGRSHVVIIGSHADQVMSSVEEKSSLLQTIIATRRVRRQLYVECIAMDCRRTNTDASRRLIATLTNSQKAITASQPVIPLLFSCCLRIPSYQAERGRLYTT